jgi:hypothetical protein
VFVPGIQLENYVPQAAVISDKGKLLEIPDFVKPTSMY